MRYFKTSHRLGQDGRCVFCDEAWTCPGFILDQEAYELAAEHEMESRRENGGREYDI